MNETYWLVSAAQANIQIFEDIFNVFAAEAAKLLGIDSTDGRIVVGTLYSVIALLLSWILFRPSWKQIEKNDNVRTNTENDAFADGDEARLSDPLSPKPLRNLGGHMAKIRSRIILGEDPLLAPMSRASQRYQMLSYKLDQTMYAARRRYHDLSSKFGVRAAVNKINERRLYWEVTRHSEKGDGLKSIFAHVQAPSHDRLGLIGQQSASFGQFDMSENHDIVMALHSAEIFSWLPEATLKVLVDNIERVVLDQNEILFENGTEVAHPNCYVVVSGKIKLDLNALEEVNPATNQAKRFVSSNHSGRELNDSEVIIGPGEMVTGLSDLIGTICDQSIVSVATAVAIEKDTVLIKINKEKSLDALFAVESSIKEQLLQRILIRINRVAFTSLFRLTGQIISHGEEKSTTAKVGKLGLSPAQTSFESNNIFTTAGKYLAKELGITRSELASSVVIGEWESAARDDLNPEEIYDDFHGLSNNSDGNGSTIKPNERSHVHLVVLNKGDDLLEISDEPALYVVIKGQLDMYAGVPHDVYNSTLQKTLRPSDSLGHLSIITGAWSEWYARRRSQQTRDLSQPCLWVVAGENPTSQEQLPNTPYGSSNSLLAAESTTTLLRVSQHAYLELTKKFPKIISQKASSLLRELSPLVRMLDATTKWVHLQAGDTLVKQGDPLNMLYVVLHGRMRATWNPNKKTNRIVDQNLFSRRKHMKKAQSWKPNEVTKHKSNQDSPEEKKRSNNQTCEKLHQNGTPGSVQSRKSYKLNNSASSENGWGWSFDEEKNRRDSIQSFSDAYAIDEDYESSDDEQEEDTSQEATFGEYGKGATMGNVSFLTERPMQHTLRAVRSTQLAALPKAVVHAMLISSPEALLHLGKTLAIRASTQFEQMQFHSREDSGRNGLGTRTIAIVPASPTVPLELFAHTLGSAIEAMGTSVQTVTSATVEKVAQKKIDSLNLSGSNDVYMQDMLITSWLNEIEETNDIVLYQADSWADPAPSWWSQYCVLQADTILFVGNATDSPRCSALEKWLDNLYSNAQRELVLLHINTTEEASRQALPPPRGTREWIENRAKIHHHHHIRFHPYEAGPGGNGLYDVTHFKSDFRRLGRWLTGTSVGLVLGGGGARGAAHIGAIRALENQGIPVDFVAGTSIGAFMGGLYALKTDQLHMRQLVSRFCGEMGSVWKKIRDLTFPKTAYLKGKGFNRTIVKTFENQKIEDLWLPYFCVTTDLTDSKAVVHRNGAMWRYVRASMTLTGYLPPVCDVVTDDEGNDKVHYLVDGGYMNNLPVDVMRNMIGPKGTVIAVDVQADWTFAGDDYGDSLNGWYYLFNWLNPWSKTKKIPTANDIQVQLAYISSVTQNELHSGPNNEPLVDLFIRPEVGHYGTLDFAIHKEIEGIGYSQANEDIEIWKNKLKRNMDNRLKLWATSRKTTPSQKVNKFKARNQPVPLHVSGRSLSWQASAQW